MYIVVVTELRPPASLIKVLAGCGMQSSVCRDVSHLSAHLKRDRPDLILCYQLGPDSLAKVRIIKEEYSAVLPLFVMSETGSALDRVVALQSGITNFYLQPFSYTRLVYDLGSVQYTIQKTNLKSFGPFTIDLANQSVTYRGTMLLLSKKQFCLLNLLLSRCNHVVSRVQIWESVWGLEQYPLANSVDALVCRVRQRIPKNAPCKIEQVYGIGYRFLTLFP